MGFSDKQGLGHFSFLFLPWGLQAEILLTGVSKQLPKSVPKLRVVWLEASGLSSGGRYSDAGQNTGSQFMSNHIHKKSLPAYK